MYEQYDFNLARESLGFLVNMYGIKKMHIPYYLCDVVRHTLVKEGCTPLFYHIDDNFYPSFSFPESDYILYPNYFGICGNNIKKLLSLYPKLIVDNAHAYYEPPSGFACFNAGHKFGLTKSKLFIKKNNSPQTYIFSKYEIEMAKERLNLVWELHEEYGKDNLLKIDTNDIYSDIYPKIYPYPYPLCIYPFLAETEDYADKLVKDLKRKGKTIYRYWNPLPMSFNEYKFYSRLVPIPVLPSVD